MPIDQNSPLWAVLADWVKILLTLPDPIPNELRPVNDLVIMTAISSLSQQLSPEVGADLRKAAPSIAARLKSAA
jgi:hypothetical protein